MPSPFALKSACSGSRLLFLFHTHPPLLKCRSLFSRLCGPICHLYWDKMTMITSKVSAVLAGAVEEHAGHSVSLSGTEEEGGGEQELELFCQ